MQRYSIGFDARFKDDLHEILDFIGADNPNAAEKFSYEIYAKIDTLKFMPFRCRRHKNYENIRDLLFKGYIIVFLVENLHIEILGIYKENLWNLKAKNE